MPEPSLFTKEKGNIQKVAEIKDMNDDSQEEGEAEEA